MADRRWRWRMALLALVAGACIAEAPGLSCVEGACRAEARELSSERRRDMDKYEVYAVRYATIAGFRLSALVAGADSSRRMDIAMMIWVLKGIDGRIAIVDS